MSKKKNIVIGAVMAGVMSFTAVPAAAEQFTAPTSAPVQPAVTASSKLAAPSGFKAASVTDTAIKLTWDKVKNAKGYRVFLYNKDSGKFETYKNVSGNSCAVKGLKAGTSYTFKVAALSKSSSGYTAGKQSDKLSVKTKLAAPKNLKATAGEETVELSWSKVSGAKAYRVFLYNSKTGKYETYKNVSSNSCTVKGLKSGTEYKFKVAALVNSGSGYAAQIQSDAVSCKTKEASQTTAAAALQSSGAIEFPSFGTDVQTAIDTLGATLFLEQKQIVEGVNCYFCTKNIGGKESTLMLYTNDDGEFFYGAVLLDTTADINAALNSKYGDPFYELNQSGVSLNIWVDLKTQCAEFTADANNIAFYGKLSIKFAPSSYKNNMTNFDIDQILSLFNF